MTEKVLKKKISAFLLATCIFSASAVAMAQQFASEEEQEFYYLECLENDGLAEYAEMVLKDIEKKYPSAKAQIKVKKLSQLLSRGKFDEAEAVIAKEPNQESPEVWAMKVSVADYYYAFGKYPEALGRYEAFFKKYEKSGPPVEIAEFYNNSYYKFAQMLLMLKQDLKALEAYEAMRASKVTMDDNMRRQIMFENAELLVRLAETKGYESKRKDYLARASKIVQDIMWVQDLWFGRAVALYAHIDIANGDIEKAQKTLDSYMPMLKSFDKSLKEQGEESGTDLMRLSPLAECRYLMGKMLHDEARKELEKEAPDMNLVKVRLVGGAGANGGKVTGALQHFGNVYVRYPSSSWAPDAGQRIDEIQQILADRLKIDASLNISAEQRREVADKQFANATMLYNQNQFNECIEMYFDVLTQYPEDEKSIPALGNLVRSYIQLASTADAETKEFYDMQADVVVGYLAERFAGRPKALMESAGNELLQIATYYNSINMVPKEEEITSLFFKNFTEHSLSATMLMTAAERAYKDEDYEKASGYYEILAQNYKKSPLSFDAMKRLADCYNKLSRIDDEISIRKEFCKRVAAREKPGNDLIVGKYTLARVLKSKAIADIKEAKTLLVQDSSAEAQEAEEPENGAENAEGEAEEKEINPKKLLQDGVKALADSIKGFESIRKDLDNESTRRKYEANPTEKETNDKILEGCLFDLAHAFTQMPGSADKAVAFKKRALTYYKALLEKFPESENRPGVLMQYGVLISSLKSDNEEENIAASKEADKAFAELSEKYPDSNEAKNVYFIRGRTLIDLGYRTQGVAVLKKMFEENDKYTAGQLLIAADELLKSRESDLANEGYDLAIKKAKEVQDEKRRDQIIAPATYGKAKVLISKKEFTKAVAILDEFQENYKTSYLLLDVLDLMTEAGVSAAEVESDEKARIDLFNKSMKAVKLVKQYKKSAKGMFEADLKEGIILEKYAKIAEKYKDDKRQNDYTRKASAKYVSMIMAADVNNADIRPVLEEAYNHGIPLMLSLGLYEDAKLSCDAYSETFPKGKYRNNVVLYKSQAEQGLISAK